MKIVTLNKIHRYIQNFMLYKMICFSSHKFAFFAILRTVLSITREICVQIKDKVHHVNQPIEPDLMMYIHNTFSKKFHSTYLFKIFFSLFTLSTAFLQKASGPGKKVTVHLYIDYTIHNIHHVHCTYTYIILCIFTTIMYTLYCRNLLTVTRVRVSYGHI